MASAKRSGKAIQRMNRVKDWILNRSDQTLKKYFSSKSLNLGAISCFKTVGKGIVEILGYPIEVRLLSH